jgi:hypothetical protein
MDVELVFISIVRPEGNVHKNTKLHRLANGVEEKECSRCKEWFPLDCYNKSTTWDSLDRSCRPCQKEYRTRNKEKLDEKKRIYRKTHKNERKVWLNANKDRLDVYNKDYQASYRKENKKELQAYFKEHYQRNKSEINEKRKERRLVDHQYRISCNLRSRVSIALRGRAKSAKTEELLGCSYEKFLKHLELKFDSEMNWDNYGEWHIDHIIPCAIFKLEDAEEQKICFHYTNLQPLWGDENMSKNDSVRELDVKELPKRVPKHVIDRIKKLQKRDKEIKFRK